VLDAQGQIECALPPTWLVKGRSGERAPAHIAKRGKSTYSPQEVSSATDTVAIVSNPEFAYLFDIGPSIEGKLHIASTYLYRPDLPTPLRFPSLASAVQHAVEQGWTLAPVPDDLHSADYPHDWFQLSDHQWKKALALQSSLKRKRKAS
jgi:hypothetical protein